MIPASQNSKWMVRFALRRDFAWEAGFVDRARVPLSRREHDEIAARMRASGKAVQPYETARSDAQSYHPPRFLGYLYTIAPGACEAWPLITDGAREFHVEHNGLWTHMEEKMNRLLCLRRDRWPVIKPHSLPEPALERVRPKHFVLHDTVRGEAGLYLWADRYDYLAADRAC